MFMVILCKLVGMKAYPLELRRRIVNVVDLQEWTIAQIADMFSVTERYVYKLLVQRNETGDVVPRPHGGGALAKLNEPGIVKLNKLITAQPDATLAELCEKLNQRRRQKVSISTVCRGLQKIKLTRKKSHVVHAKRARHNARPSPKDS
jgi:transposase